MKRNVKELLELLVFFFALQEAIKKTLEDKKVNFLDAFRFAPVLPTIKPAFADLGNPVERLRELTPDERGELQLELIAKFDIPNDEIEGLVERTVQNAANLIDLARDWSRIGKMA